MIRVAGEIRVPLESLRDGALSRLRLEATVTIRSREQRNGELTFVETAIRRACEDGHAVRIVYFGDCDPSGMVIESSSKRRLSVFLADLISFGADITWERAGIDQEDIATYGLISVPVKHSDSRAKAYLAEHGDVAAELDALPPDVLNARILEAITSSIDVSAWDRVTAIQMAEQESLDMVADHFETALAAVRRSP